MIIMSVLERFEAKFVKKENGCWEWTAAKFPKGYGAFKYKGKSIRTNRVSYMLYIGDIPKDKHVLHKCNNRGCVNPEHLYAGTNKDKMRDKDDVPPNTGGGGSNDLSNQPKKIDSLDDAITQSMQEIESRQS